MVSPMSALYQRARPIRFDEVVGQEHVKDVLLAGLRSGRTGHAYLFSGPRGVGKTTTARLLAMAVNCEDPDVSRRPCGTCESCILVQSGSHPDVMELDAASNNSVDDVRDLREKVSLASLRGGTRVWILDEAHMLSRPAANALLKTLEEPPPGLMFVLATTEPEKLPATVLSRCQHFRFRRLSDGEIGSKLAALCRSAGAEAAAEALALVAHAADGGMRDAESMLERLLVVDGPITLEAAEGALGLPPRERLRTLASAVAAGDVHAAQATAAALYRDGFSPRTLAEQLGRCLRDALFEQVSGGDGFQVPLDEPTLMRLIQALDDDLERFVRRGDLYALELTIIKGINVLSLNDAGAGAALDRPSAAGDASAPTLVDGARRASVPEDAAPTVAPPSHVVPDAVAVAATPGDVAPAPHPRGRAAAQNGEPPPFEPTPGSGRRKAGGATGPRATPARRAAATTDAAQPTEREVPATHPGKARPVSWHAIKTDADAPPQLKAFLKPAHETIEGNVITLRYEPAGKFHYTQILKCGPELDALIERVAGPGFTVLIQGPDGGTPKKS